MSIPETMQAILLTGYGGLDRLKVVDDHPVPVPDEGEVLIEVGAAAGVGDRDALLMEKLLAFKRAGCRGVLTYHAPRAAQLLNG